jgi:hypothetical protein
MSQENVEEVDDPPRRCYKRLMRGVRVVAVAVALAMLPASGGGAVAATQPELDQSFTSGDDLVGIINECCNFVGQTFTAGRDGTLAAVNVDIYGNDGTPGDEAPLRVSIRNTENGLPGETVLATTVVNSQNIPLSRLITFPRQPRIHSGVSYAIVVNLENPSPRDRAGWIGATGNRYPRGVHCARFTYSGLGDWFCYTGANDPFNQGFDLHFRTYVNPVPTSRSQCKHGGWRDFGFKNQGQCIRFVKHGQNR